MLEGDLELTRQVDLELVRQDDLELVRQDDLERRGSEEGVSCQRSGVAWSATGSVQRYAPVVR